MAGTSQVTEVVSVRVSRELVAMAKKHAETVGKGWAAWVSYAMRLVASGEIDVLRVRAAHVEALETEIASLKENAQRDANALARAERQLAVIVTKSSAKPKAQPKTPDPMVEATKRQLAAKPAKPQPDLRWNAKPECTQCGAPLMLNKCPLGCN